MKEEIINTYDPIISYFHDGKLKGINNTTNQSRIHISRLFKGITTYDGWKNTTAKVRDVFEQYGKNEEYKAAKRQLDYFLCSGVWTNRRPDGKLIQPSYLLQIDIDSLRPEDMPGIKKLLIEDQHSILVFQSPSGIGFKCFVRYTPNSIPLPCEVVFNYYAKLGITIDKSTLHDKQACFLVHDSEAYLNLDATSFVFKAEEKTTSHGRGIVSEPECIASNSDALHVQAFCKKVIEAESSILSGAAQGQGQDALNKCSYNLGRYFKAGLSKTAAEQALLQSFKDRKYSKHSDTEFSRIFSKGFNAGMKEPGSIKNRPYKPPKRQN